MAVVVVDVLEVVEIDEHECRPVSAHLCGVQCFTGLLHQHAAVGQTGEVVQLGLVFQHLLGLLGLLYGVVKVAQQHGCRQPDDHIDREKIQCQQAPLQLGLLLQRYGCEWQIQRVTQPKHAHRDGSHHRGGHMPTEQQGRHHGGR